MKDFVYERSKLAWESEGRDDECSRFHWPGGRSGVTMGKGYDLSRRERPRVKRELEACGIDPDIPLKAVGLTGEDAKAFCASYQHFILSRNQMVALFNREWDRQAAEVARICNKADVVERYGRTHTQSLNPYIWEFLVDLKYRGDYTPLFRRHFQALVVANDLEGIQKKYKKYKIKNEPQDRRRHRELFLDNAIMWCRHGEY